MSGLAAPLLDGSDIEGHSSQCARTLVLRPRFLCYLACTLLLSAAVLYPAGGGSAGAGRYHPSSAAQATTASRPFRVLVTGYGAFDSMTDNPSQMVALELNGTCTNGLCIEGWVLSVDTQGASRVAQTLTAGYHDAGRVAAWDAGGGCSL